MDHILRALDCPHLLSPLQKASLLEDVKRIEMAGPQEAQDARRRVAAMSATVKARKVLDAYEGVY